MKKYMQCPITKTVTVLSRSKWFYIRCACGIKINASVIKQRKKMIYNHPLFDKFDNN